MRTEPVPDDGAPMPCTFTVKGQQCGRQAAVVANEDDVGEALRLLIGLVEPGFTITSMRALCSAHLRALEVVEQ